MMLISNKIISNQYSIIIENKFNILIKKFYSLSNKPLTLGSNLFFFHLILCLLIYFKYNSSFFPYSKPTVLFRKYPPSIGMLI